MHQRKLATCPNCAGYHFPHRRGSLYCTYRQDGSRRLPGDADFRDRYLEKVHGDLPGDVPGFGAAPAGSKDRQTLERALGIT